MKSMKQKLVVLLLIVIGFVLYTNSFSNQMFWDDDDIILKNQFIQNWRYFPKYFSENLIAGAGLLSDYWRPMLLSVFSLEWKMWEDWQIGYHFVNTSFHIIDAILLFFILFYVFKKPTLAAFTALLFLVHPFINFFGQILSKTLIFNQMVLSFAKK